MNPRYWKGFKAKKEDWVVLNAARRRREIYYTQQARYVRMAGGSKVRNRDGSFIRFKHILQASSSAAEDTQLFQLVRYLGVRTCLELGTGGGLSAMCLHGAISRNAFHAAGTSKYVGIDRCAARVRLTFQSLQRITPSGRSSFTLIRKPFDRGLPEALGHFHGRLGFAYVDGELDNRQTLTCFKLIAAAMPHGCIVIDDVHRIKHAVGKLYQHPRVADVTGIKDHKLLFRLKKDRN